MSTQDIVDHFVQQHRREARDEGRQEGRQEGREEGLVEAVLDVYAERFGAPPAEVSDIVRRTHDRGALRGWLKLATTATAEDVLRAMTG